MDFPSGRLNHSVFKALSMAMGKRPHVKQYETIVVVCVFSNQVYKSGPPGHGKAHRPGQNADDRLQQDVASDYLPRLVYFLEGWGGVPATVLRIVPATYR